MITPVLQPRPSPNFFEINSPLDQLAKLLWGAHQQIRAQVRHAMAQATIEELAAVAAHIEVDTLFRIDEIAEKALFDYLDQHAGPAPPFLLVGEFAAGPALRFGKGEPLFRVLFDPIDGTRLLMYAKNSGWILSGIFPEKGEDTRLAQSLFALQTEIPLLKHLYTETFWAVPAQGAQCLRENILTGRHTLQPVQVPTSTTLLHGFVSFVNFFPNGKTVVAALEEDFLRQALAGEASAAAAAPVFEDQHLSTAAQLHALWQNQLKLVVDVRPQLNQFWRARQHPTVLSAHPYDLAAWLIAQEAGVVLLSPEGSPFDGATEATAEVGWLGFSHRALWERHGAMMLHTLTKHGLIE